MATDKRNYKVDYTDPTKQLIKVIADTIAGPNGGVRQVDVDLIGMGHSLWGEAVLENFLHLLENFSCREDLHDISLVVDANTFEILGDVRKSFLKNESFQIVGSSGSPSNDGTYVVSAADPVFDGTKTTIIVTGSPGILNPAIMDGQAGHPDFPDKNLKFSPVTPIEGQLWFNQTKQELYVYRASGSPATFQWESLGLLQFLLDNYYNRTYVDALETSLRVAIDEAAPVASVKEYAGSVAPPAGWLLCDGSAVSRTTYADLFAAVSTTYGVGDGSTTFNVPDMRGRVAVGLNPGGGPGISNIRAGSLNDSAGSEYHTLVTNEMPNHVHSVSITAVGDHTHSGTTNTTGNHNHSGTTGAAGAHNHGISWNRSEGGDGDNEISSWTGFANGVTGPVGDHTHNFTGMSQNGNHSHSFTTAAAGGHTHPVTEFSVGGNLQHENTQPFLTLNYIIKT